MGRAWRGRVAPGPELATTTGDDDGDKDAKDAEVTEGDADDENNYDDNDDDDDDAGDEDGRRTTTTTDDGR